MTASAGRRFGSSVIVTVWALVTVFTGVARAGDGSLDPSFGGDGKVVTAITSGAYANEVAIQPDGRIVAVGAAAGRSSTGVFAVARYLPDGTLDAGFGGGGTVTTAVTEGGDEATAVAIQPDGKIVVGGSNRDRFELVRYEADGTLDPTFGTGGLVTTDVTPAWDVAWDMALLANGKIVLAGYGTPGGPWRPAFALVRYTSEGTLDAGFGDGGILVSRRGTARAIAVQPDGRLVAAGYSASGVALARYLRDGSLDATFGGDGTVDALPGDGALAIALQPDGRIVVGGSHDVFTFEVARFTAAGRLDRTFGGDGAVTTDVGGSEQAVADLVIQPNGKVIAVGHAGPHEAGTSESWRFVITRYRGTGVLDPTFGGDGAVNTRFRDGAAAEGGALQADRRLVVVGGQGEFTNDAFAIARYVP
jgi:uncharacterized delta-60 repeat protein